MDGISILFIVAVVAACFGFLGSWICGEKGRSRTEGAIIGTLFGPLGVLVVSLLPSVTKRLKSSRSEFWDNPPEPTWLSELDGQQESPEKAWLRGLEVKHREQG